MTLFRNIRVLVLALLCAAASGLAGCSDSNPVGGPDKPVDVLYNEAVDHMMDHEYTAASHYFDEVERQHPYSVWATKAQLMQVYVNYEAQKYDDAISAADRFVQLHPGNRDVPYAYYVKAISYYEQIVDIERDQTLTLDAQQSLQDVVNRFPDSKYARDARLKLALVRDHLAGKEMEIGRFYERKQIYIAAINRYKHVISDYQQTSHVPEALARLSECYTAIGLPREAKQSASVLGYNYPDSDWYKDTYSLEKDGGRTSPDRPGWFGQVIDYIF